MVCYFLPQMLRSMDEGDLADYFSVVGRKLMNPNYDPREERDPGDIGGATVDEVPALFIYDDLDDALRDKESKYRTGKPRVMIAESNALEMRVQKINKQRELR
jgi:hypothetical protein